jgi:hypothetical protein
MATEKLEKNFLVSTVPELQSWAPHTQKISGGMETTKEQQK